MIYLLPVVLLEQTYWNPLVLSAWSSSTIASSLHEQAGEEKLQLHSRNQKESYNYKWWWRRHHQFIILFIPSSSLSVSTSSSLKSLTWGFIFSHFFIIMEGQKGWRWEHKQSKAKHQQLLLCETFLHTRWRRNSKKINLLPQNAFLF